MPLNNRYSFGYFFLTIVTALALKVLPWPAAIHSLNPDWIVLILIYWFISSPEKMGVFNAFIIGLLADTLTGRLLGQHALAYSVIGFICIKQHKRLRHFPLFQQSLIILLLLLVSLFILFWTENLQNPTSFQASFLLPALTGTVLWPFIYKLLDNLNLLRRK